MDFLSDLDEEQVAALSDDDFQEAVQTEARSHAGDALRAYVEVATESDDDQARVKAADRLIAIGGFQEKAQKAALPSGVSEEVFRLAIAGLGQLAGIARSSASVDAILRNVTPAKVDPRPQVTVTIPALTDDSPLNRMEDNDEVVELFAKERYEIHNPGQ